MSVLADVKMADSSMATPVNPTRLLVVDDDIVQRRIIAKIAAQAGHTVVEAGSVEEANAILESDAINCVTIDLSLGERSGVEVLSALGARARNVPVLIISGMPSDVLQSVTRYAAECGLVVHATFAKPLDLNKLRNSLRVLMQICDVMGPITYETGPAAV